MVTTMEYLPEAFASNCVSSGFMKRALAREHAIPRSFNIFLTSMAVRTILPAASKSTPPSSKIISALPSSMGALNSLSPV